MHTQHFHGLLQKERPVTNRKTAALRSEGEFISNQHVSEDNGDGRSDDDRTIVDDVSEVFVGYHEGVYLSQKMEKQQALTLTEKSFGHIQKVRHSEGGMKLFF